jgi:UDP-N-acetylglucosamine 4,6-dehydratase
MTRFFIQLPDVCSLVVKMVDAMKGGEIFLPKMTAYRLPELAKRLFPHAQLAIVGIREGEKLHEDMVCESDSRYVWDCGEWYAVSKDGVGKRMPETFSYCSKEGCE